MNDPSRKVVVITGATGNLGRATADLFLKSDARLVLVDRLTERLQSHYPLLIESPDHLLVSECDIANSESVVTMVQRSVDRFGRIDVLVNTVGGYRGGKRVDESDLKDWDFLMDINLRTTLHCCRAVAPHFIQQRSGHIVNVAGRAALVGSGLYGAYCVSKAAVLRLTERRSTTMPTCVRLIWSDRQTRVSCRSTWTPKLHRYLRPQVEMCAKRNSIHARGRCTRSLSE